MADPLGVGRREHDGEHRALDLGAEHGAREPQASRTAITSSICSSSVAGSSTGVGEAGAAAVEGDQPRVLGEPLQHLRAGGSASTSIVPRLGRTIQ